MRFTCQFQYPDMDAWVLVLAPGAAARQGWAILGARGTIPGHALHEKGLQGQKKRRSIVRQPGTKRASRPGDKPLINRWSTADSVPPSVCIGFRLFVLLERRWSDVSSIPWRERWTFVSWANSSVGTQSCPTPPGRSAGRSDPTRPWYVRDLDSTGLPRKWKSTVPCKER